MSLRSSLPAAALALLLVAGRGAAFADDPAPVAPDPAAQDKSQALVDRTDHGREVFRVDAAGTIIHIQSGMACPRGNELLMLDRLMVTPGVPVGDDAGCDYRTPSGKTTIFATRRGAWTLERYAAGTFAAIRKVHPDARPIGGQISLLYPEISKPIRESFAITQNNTASITSAWIAQEGDWLILVRATYPAEPRHDPEFAAALAMMYAQLSVYRSAVK
jgi:hypothetical protein